MSRYALVPAPLALPDMVWYNAFYGNIDEAEKEFPMANRGKQIIEKFWTEGADPMTEIERKLVELKASIASLRSDLDTYPC